MRRVRRHNRFLYGQVMIRLLIVDTPAKPISNKDRARIYAFTLDATRLLSSLSRSWAQTRNPPIPYQICQFAIAWWPRTVSPPAGPAMTGQLSVDIPAQETVWMPTLQAALGLTPAGTGLRNDEYAVLSDEAAFLFDHRPGGRDVAEVVTVVVTTMPLGWSGYASGSEPVVFLQWERIQAEYDSLERVIAHEICHVFGALDEYRNDAQHYVCDVAETGGVLQFSNANCVANGTNQTCLMRGLEGVLCDQTPLHLGWMDLEGDTLLDPIVFPEITRVEVVNPSFDHQTVRVHGRGLEFTNRVRFNGIPADDVYIDSQPGVVAHIPDGVHGRLETSVQTVTGSARTDDTMVVTVP